MSRIKIKNFGPIKEGFLTDSGWIDIKKVTVFIGDQGSGKSTVAKLISTFTWIEKALVRGDLNIKLVERKNGLKNKYLKYHRLENYFKANGSANTLIEYEGKVFSFRFKDGLLKVEETERKEYQLPQIMYVPAERNFISYVRSPKGLKLTSDSLKEFLTEFENAKQQIKGPNRLPIDNVEIEFNKQHDILYVKGDGYRLDLSEASSGFQSLVPMYLVTSYLSNSVKRQSENNQDPMSQEEMNRFKKGVEDIMNNKEMTDDQKRTAISVLSAKFNKSAFINIVEEPEQNLFPTSQWTMLQSLLKFNNVNKGNKLIMTTHSPYIINYLSIAIQGEYLENKIMGSSEADINVSGETNPPLSKLYKLLPKESLISAKDVVVYQMKESDGTIEKLETIDGIPSDMNYLNDTLMASNALFDSLLEIEQEL